MTVEDGTGLTDSDSYVTTDYADSYLAGRNTAWAALTAANKEIALQIATEYIDNIFRWKGIKSTATQALNFPRARLFDNDGYEISGIPVRLKQAVCLAASVYINGDTLFQEQEEKGDVASESVSGAVSVSYVQGSKKTDQTLYDSVNMKLRGLYIDSNKPSIVESRIER